MSIVSLLESLRCQMQPYHLENGDGWRVRPGLASSDQTELLQRLAADLQKEAATSPLALPEIDLLVKGVQQISLAPPAPAVVALFSRALNSSHVDPFQKLYEAADCHLRKIPQGNFDLLKRSLEYLVKNDDLLRFAGIYREAYYAPHNRQEAFESGLQEFIDDMCRKYPLLWLKKVLVDSKWPCSVVAFAEFKDCPKFLDLTACELKSIQTVLQGHAQYSQLFLRLSVNHEALAILAQEKLIDNVVELDLQAAFELEWGKVQGILCKLKKLDNIKLPSTLKLEGSLVEWDLSWPESLKKQVQHSLERIFRQQASRRDFTYVSHLMRGVQKSVELSKMNRIQTNFLLSLPDWFKRAKPLKCLSVSGIQKITWELLSQIPFHSEKVLLYLSYCPKITREGFLQLVGPQQNPFAQIYLQSCPQADDHFFEGHPLLTVKNWYKGKLALDFTKVTQGLILRLQSMQPGATITHTPSYLLDLEKMGQECLGLDTTGLSTEASQSLLTFLYTGTFPVVTLQVAMELIESEAKIILDPAVAQRFKNYCSYILQINVDRSNVAALHAFALKREDLALEYVCRVFVQTFLSPDLGDIWQNLSDEEKRIFQAILSAPEEEPETIFNEDLLYIHIRDHPIAVEPERASLSENVNRNDFVNFARAYQRSPASQREAHLQKLMAQYPQRRWLTLFRDNPERAFSLIPISWQVYVPKLLDLRGLDEITIRYILSQFLDYKKLECRLNCSQIEFLTLAESGAFLNVVFLDLRECTGLDWIVIEPCLLHMKQLQNFILPLTLAGLSWRTALSSSWTPDMYRIAAYHLIHVFATRSDQKNEYFLEQEGPGYSQSITIANIIIRQFPSEYMMWDKAYKDIVGVYLLNASFHRKVAKFPPNMDLKAMDFVGPLLSTCEFQEGPLSLLCDYMSSFTPQALQSLCKKQMSKLSLYGCSHVDDSFFTDMPPATRQTLLDLQGTGCSQALVGQLCSKGYNVLYDQEYLSLRKSWQKRIDSNSGSLLEATMYFLYTGYYPLLTVPLAMDIVRCDLQMDDERTRLLKNFASSYLLLNVTKENVLALYQFAKIYQLAAHVNLCRKFMEIFCNPYYPQVFERADEALYGPVFRDEPPTTCLSLPLNGQKVEPLRPKTSKEKTASLSANFEASATSSEDL